MAVKFDAGEGASRSKDTFLANPYEIAFSSVRARHDIPTDEQVRALADSIKANNQLTPIQCRRISTGRLEVIDGETRLRAVRLLHDDDPQWRVSFTVETNINDETAFQRAVVSNKDRNESTLIDTAYNLVRFMDSYGWTAQKCAAFYGWPNQSKVSYVRSLTGLPAEAQKRVSDGTLSMKAALDLLKLPEAKAVEIVQEATQEGEQAAASASPKKRAKVKKTAARKAASKKAAEAVKETGKQSPRTLAELKSVLAGRADAVSESLRAYLAGDPRCGDKELSRVLSNHDLEERVRRDKSKTKTEQVATVDEEAFMRP